MTVTPGRVTPRGRVWLDSHKIDGKLRRTAGESLTGGGDRPPAPGWVCVSFLGR
jgi:hypothetical protein